jgi:hypothetical protein
MIVQHERSELNLRFRPQKPIDIGVAGNGWVESCRDNAPLSSDKEEWLGEGDHGRVQPSPNACQARGPTKGRRNDALRGGGPGPCNERIEIGSPEGPRPFCGKSAKLLKVFGVPDGIRTRVTAVKE